jgi:hypothetical protein
MVKDGTAVTRSLSQTEIDDMLALNAGFFGKMVQFRTGLARVVDQCQIFEVFQGKHVINTVRRLIVPGDAQDEAIALIKGKGFDLEVVSLESIGKDEAK